MKGTSYEAQFTKETCYNLYMTTFLSIYIAFYTAKYGIKHQSINQSINQSFYFKEKIITNY
jgi:hypothetical protein